MASEWSKSFPSRNVAVVTCKLPKAADEHWVLLRTDAHHDNAHCDQDRERRHLDEALERNASIIDAGDIFCAMQGKWDKRADRSQLREEYQYGPYLDTLVDVAADFYAPYARNWIVLGRGNHEQSIYRKHETDLIERLSARLSTGGNVVQAGGYTGVVHFQLRSGSKKTSVVLRYAHGAGGGGPVTLGTIQSTNRYPMQWEGVDVQFSGHFHDPIYTPARVRCRYDRNNQRIEKRTLHIIQGATYKDEYDDGHSGYHVENMRGPRAQGAWWLRLAMGQKQQNKVVKLEPAIEVRRAD